MEEKPYTDEQLRRAAAEVIRDIIIKHGPDGARIPVNLIIERLEERRTSNRVLKYIVFKEIDKVLGSFPSDPQLVAEEINAKAKV